MGICARDGDDSSLPKTSQLSLSGDNRLDDHVFVADFYFYCKTYTLFMCQGLLRCIAMILANVGRFFLYIYWLVIRVIEDCLFFTKS